MKELKSLVDSRESNFLRLVLALVLKRRGSELIVYGAVIVYRGVVPHFYSGGDFAAVNYVITRSQLSRYFDRKTYFMLIYQYR